MRLASIRNKMIFPCFSRFVNTLGARRVVFVFVIIDISLAMCSCLPLYDTWYGI